MLHTTKHQINQYYDKYHEIAVTFNQKVIESTQFIPGEMQFKIGTDKYNCILNSSSMEEAHVILRANKKIFELINKNNKWVSLRMAFKRGGSSSPLAFFIKSKVKSYSHLKGQFPDLYIFHLDYNQQPPDDFIKILGELIAEGANLNKRRHERISLNNETMDALNLESSSGIIGVQNNNIPCIIRDVSLTGCKIIVKGIEKQFRDQKIIIMMRFRDEDHFTQIPGIVVRTDSIEDNISFLSLGIQFIKDKIPPRYLTSITEYTKETENEK